METQPPFDTSSEPTMVTGRAVEPPAPPPPSVSSAQPTVIGGRTVEPPQPPFTPSPPPAPAKGGSSKTIIIVVVVLLVLCCCCAVIAGIALAPAIQEQIESISSLLMPFLPLA
jgi:hypothetical protein